MNREQLAEELDRDIEGLMGGHPPQHNDNFLQIAAELRMLPTDEFRQSLRADLMERGEAMRTALADTVVNAEHLPLSNPEFMPALSQREFGVLPADPRSLLLSFASHAAVVALIVSGIWVGHQTVIKGRTWNEEINYLPLTPGTVTPKGGGGGGDHSMNQAGRGAPPKFSDEQLTPPVIVVRVEKPKLPADPTVLGPPQLKVPQSERIGDWISSNVVIPSNGTGGGGIGDSYGTGDGIGNGPGVGAGRNGGFGGDTYRVGNGVSAPRAVYSPDPEYSDEARRVKMQGNVVLSLVVDPRGHVRDVRVARSLGMGLDEKAIEAVRKWKFEPGVRDGYPVPVQVNVEVNFRLY